MVSIKVRKHRRKGKKVRTHKRKINRISKRKRNLFSSMAKHPDEVGGQLDFEKGKLDNAKVHFGSGSALEFPWDSDYEVSYHSHPRTQANSIMPSYQDIISMKDTNEKEQLILFGDLVLSVSESNKFQKVPNKKISMVSNLMQRDLNKGYSDRKLYNKYRPIFRNELGLNMRWHKPGSNINLDTRSV